MNDITREKLTTIASNLQGVYDAGVNAGKQGQYDTDMLSLWKALTGNGTRTVGARMFYGTDFTGYKFPKPIIITEGAYRMFNSYQGTELPRKEDIDLSECVVTSQSGETTSCAWLYSYAPNITYVPDYGLPAPYDYQNFINRSRNVVTVEKLRSAETTLYSNSFYEAKSLKNITFEGIIGQNISFSSSPLTVDSMKSIISHLKDYSGTENEFKFTLTFSSARWELLEAEGATAEYTDSEGNTSYITWTQLIENKKWNRA